jgi:uncharacterized membrane protein
LAPFYLVLQGPLFLLYVQVLAVGLAAVPLYLLARAKLPGKRAALIVAAAFLLFRPLLNGLMYDFHPEMFFPLFIFSAHYHLTIKKNSLLFGIFIALALLIKEDFAVYVFFYCLWLACSTERKAIPLGAAMASAAYGLLAITVFIPFFRGQVNASSPYEFLGKWQDYGGSVQEIARRIMAQPLRLWRDLNVLPNLLRLGNYLLPLLLLPILDPLVLLILPPLVVGWLSRIPLMATFGLYYGAPLLTFLFLALVHALERLGRPRDTRPSRHPAAGAWILNLLLVASLFNFKWNLFVPAKYRNLRDYPAVRECLKQIPAQASLAVQSAIMPHVPKRRAIAMLPEIGGSEFILLHLEVNPWPLQANQLQELADRLRRSPEFRCLCSSGSLRLYRKTAP